MTRPRYEPDDPREWLSRARSNLRLAAAQDPGIHLEELCYNAQQAAEKAIKAVFVKLGKPFPYTHNLAQLLGRLSGAGMEVPAEVGRAVDLTRFAYEARYPSVGPEVTPEMHEQCLGVAQATVEWAETIIQTECGGSSNQE